MASTHPVSNIVKVGYVEAQSRHIKKWSKRWFVLYENAATSPARLVKYLDEKDAKKGKPRHEYYINDMEAVERPKPKTIHITLKTKQCTDIFFNCDSEAGAEEWRSCLQKTIENRIDMFPANIISAQHTTFQGEVNLYVADGCLTIIQGDEILTKIPLTTIRKYKQEDKDLIFWIETGRSSPVGEGFITCQSAHAYNILTKLDDQARTLNRTWSTSSTGSDPSANCLYSPEPFHPPARQRQRFMSEPSLPPYLPDRNTPTQATGYSNNGRPNPPRRPSYGSSSETLGPIMIRSNDAMLSPSRLVRSESRRPSEPAMTKYNANPYLPMNNPVTKGPPPPLRAPDDEGTPYTDMAGEASDYLRPIEGRQDDYSPYPDRPHENSNDQWDYLSPVHPAPNRIWRQDRLS